jgi:hypothetical protein
MKKTILSLTTLVIGFAAMAQIKLGVQAGVVASTPNVSSFASPKTYASPTFGLIAQADLGPLLLRPSVNYLSSGLNESVSNTVAGVTTTALTEVRMKNLEIPLDITLPIKTKSGRFLLSAAPVLTIGLNAEVSTSYSASNGSQVHPTTSVSPSFGDGAGEIKKIDWGTRFGLGYEFKAGLQINAAYKMGLTNLDNNPGETYKNHHLTLGVAYFLFK